VNDSVKLVECPRDAWQGLKGHIPAHVKSAYLRVLIEAGFKHIDAVSFVSPKAVPQMADSEQVLEELGDVPEDVELIGIVAKKKGTEPAAAVASQISTLGFPYSLSPTFLQRNQNQSLEQAYEMLERIAELADKAGQRVVCYISMAFGNPYGDAWSAEEVAVAVDLLEKSAIRSISLADTVGLATPEQVRALVEPVLRAYDHLDIGVHLHSRPSDAVNKILAAYDAGCRRFDSAIGGFGGCPFAQDELVGNIPTEAVLEALALRGVPMPPLKSLSTLTRSAAGIAAQFGAVTGIQ
jgi:hydroxymethylglutaryl-CoA lyase